MVYTNPQTRDGLISEINFLETDISHMEDVIQEKQQRVEQLKQQLKEME